METTNRITPEHLRIAAQEFLRVADRPRVYKGQLQLSYSDRICAARKGLNLGISEQKVQKVTGLDPAIVKIVAGMNTPSWKDSDKTSDWVLDVVSQALQDGIDLWR